MEAIIVGKVTIEEKNQIMTCFERKHALLELAPVVKANNTALYEQVIKDLEEVKTQMSAWWSEMAKKYKWKGTKNGMWNINFTTCEIELIKNAA